VTVIRITLRHIPALVIGALCATVIAGCSGTVALTSAHRPTARACTDTCAPVPPLALNTWPTPSPAADPALSAYRALVHTRVSQLETEGGAIDNCGEDLSKASDQQACHRAIESLMHDAKDARAVLTASPIPGAAFDTSQKLADALDLLVQGCIHDDQALTSTAMFVWLPGSTTVSALNQLVGLDDDLQMS
jgi:hypothetical protein